MGIDLGRFKSKNNDEWVDWLADDPIPASLRNRMRAKAVQDASRPIVRRVGQQPAQPPVAQQQKNQSAEGSSVSIHISIPSFKKPDFSKLRSKLPQNLPKGITYKQLGIGSGALIAVLVIGGFTLNAHNKRNNKPTEGKGVLSAADQKPDFKTVVPTNDTSKASTQKYDTKRKVVSFTDSIGGVDITISQQQLPGGFAEDTDNKVKKLAQDFSANRALTIANPTAYIGDDIKGPQTVVFTKKGLLIFILSTKKIDDHDWAEYITHLE